MVFPMLNDNDLILILILRHLMDRDFLETAHCLERESGIYFNLQHFEELIKSGCFEEAEQYVQGFTSIQDNNFSLKLIFHIKTLKLMETLHEEQYGRVNYDKQETRNRVVEEMKKLIRGNPAINGKLELPTTEDVLRRMFFPRTPPSGGLLAIIPFIHRFPPS